MAKDRESLKRGPKVLEQKLLIDARTETQWKKFHNWHWWMRTTSANGKRKLLLQSSFGCDSNSITRSYARYYEYVCSTISSYAPLHSSYALWIEGLGPYMLWTGPCLASRTFCLFVPVVVYLLGELPTVRLSFTRSTNSANCYWLISAKLTKHVTGSFNYVCLIFCKLNNICSL